MCLMCVCACACVPGGAFVLFFLGRASELGPWNCGIRARAKGGS